MFLLLASVNNSYGIFKQFLKHFRFQTADEYLSEYDSRRGNEYSRFHGYTYDGIWAAALAIQYVSQRKEQFLHEFQYRVKDWENIFLEALKNTSFEGVTVSHTNSLNNINKSKGCFTILSNKTFLYNRSFSVIN